MAIYFGNKKIDSLAFGGNSFGYAFIGKNGVWSKGGKFMPVKGDLITMSLGNATPYSGTQNLYRVLSINGSQAFVVAMYDQTNTTYNLNKASTTIGEKTCAKYQDGNLDAYLNSTFYSSLNDEAKAAIVAQDIKQDAWYFNTSGNPSYSGYYGTSNPGTTAYSTSLYSNNGAAYTVDVGSRYVFALSVQDVIDYVTDTTVGDGQLQNYNIWKMMWNTTSQPSPYTFPWLRSAFASDTNQYAYQYACNLMDSYGSIDANGVAYSRGVRPAFVIDLSKIDFKK